MKKVIYAIFILLFIGVNSYAQKKTGNVYSEHKLIDETRALWEAFVDGDTDKYLSFFADSIYSSRNGDTPTIMASKDMAGTITWWEDEFENLVIEDAKPAYPDMIEMKGFDYVQDWLMVSARHIKTGINVRMPLHNIYFFNEDGIITFIHQYFDNDIFDEITNSQTKMENGKVYINHPYILEVRKLINAYQDRDVETWASFYSPKAKFGYSWLEYGKTLSFEEVKKSIAEDLSNMDNKFKIDQVGYPDCIYYAKGDSYVVYSWWKRTIIKEGKKYSYPFMISHTFNKEGKIIDVFVYHSTNHFDGM